MGAAARPSRDRGQDAGPDAQVGRNYSSRLRRGADRRDVFHGMAGGGKTACTVVIAESDPAAPPSQPRIRSHDLAELYATGRAPVPTDHDVVCTRVGTVDGVHLRELLDRLPNTTGSHQSDVAAICAMAQQFVPHLDTAGDGG